MYKYLSYVINMMDEGDTKIEVRMADQMWSKCKQMLIEVHIIVLTYNVTINFIFV